MFINQLFNHTIFKEMDKNIKKVISEQDIKKLNKYLFDNSITLNKSQKTLFIASVLICLKIDDNILSDYDESSNFYLIADKMLEIINVPIFE